MAQNDEGRGGQDELAISDEQMEIIRERIKAIVQERILQQVLDTAKTTAMARTAKQPVNDSAGRITQADRDFGAALDNEWTSAAYRRNYARSVIASVSTGAVPKVLTNYQEVGKTDHIPGIPAKTKKLPLWKRLAHRLARKSKKSE